MIITLIAAHDPNLVIGSDGELPWYYPEDLKHFKKHTTGQVIIMGRGVFEELGEKPLPNRKNIVLSRSKNYENVETYTSLEAALKNQTSEEVFIIGGGVLYKETLLNADRLIITEIKKNIRVILIFLNTVIKLGNCGSLTMKKIMIILSF